MEKKRKGKEKKTKQNKKNKKLKGRQNNKTTKRTYNNKILEKQLGREKNERNEAKSIIKKSEMTHTMTQESTPLATYFNHHNYVSLVVFSQRRS